MILDYREETEMDDNRTSRIADAVEDIERNVTRLRELQDIRRSEYKTVETPRPTRRGRAKVREDNRGDTGHRYRNSQRRTQVCAAHRKRKITGLEQVGVLESPLADRIRESVEFRDVLAHTYGPIVNDDIVYDALQNSLERYIRFLEAVADYLSNLSEKKYTECDHERTV